MKKIMILGGGYLQVPGIKKAKELGLYVICVDMNPVAPGFEYADKSYTISTIDYMKLLEIAMNEKIDGIMTLASDMPVRTVAYISEKLGFNFMSTKDAEVATNKILMRKRLDQHNIPQPKFFIASTIDEYKKIISNFPDKYIVKPADNSGGRGIFLVDKVSRSEDAFNYSKKFAKCGDILIEEYMDGMEVSVESITINGKTEVIAITDKLTSGAPYFVEIGHTIPSMLSRNIINQIKKITIDTINAVGIKNGPSHTEVKITNDGPKIVEIGARLGGGNITSDLVPLATGVDMISASIKLAMDESVNIEAHINNGAALRYVDYKEGKLLNVKNIDLVKSMEGIEKVNILKNTGEKLTTLKSCDDRVAYVIARGKDSFEAISKCEDAINNIKIEVE